MTAIKCEPGGKAEILPYCNLCGECLDVCAGRCLTYTVFGFDLPESAAPFGRLVRVKYFYVFSALTLGAVFASLWAPGALRDAVMLILGGHHI